MAQALRRALYSLRQLVRVPPSRGSQPLWEGSPDGADGHELLVGGYLQGDSGELWVLEQLRRRARAGSDRPLVVFDVGANHGKYATTAVRVLGDRSGCTVSRRLPGRSRGSARTSARSPRPSSATSGSATGRASRPCTPTTAARDLVAVSPPLPGRRDPADGNLPAPDARRRLPRAGHRAGPPPEARRRGERAKGAAGAEGMFGAGASIRSSSSSARPRSTPDRSSATFSTCSAGFQIQRVLRGGSGPGPTTTRSGRSTGPRTTWRPQARGRPRPRVSRQVPHKRRFDRVVPGGPGPVAKDPGPPYVA